MLRRRAMSKRGRVGPAVRHRFVFWVILVPFFALAFLKFRGALVAPGLFVLVFWVLSKVLRPQACGVQTSRMEGPCSLRNGHPGPHSSL